MSSSFTVLEDLPASLDCEASRGADKKGRCSTDEDEGKADVGFFIVSVVLL